MEDFKGQTISQKSVQLLLKPVEFCQLTQSDDLTFNLFTVLFFWCFFFFYCLNKSFMLGQLSVFLFPQ